MRDEEEDGGVNQQPAGREMARHRMDENLPQLPGPTCCCWARWPLTFFWSASMRLLRSFKDFLSMLCSRSNVLISCLSISTLAFS